MPRAVLTLASTLAMVAFAAVPAATAATPRVRLAERVLKAALRPELPLDRRVRCAAVRGQQSTGRLRFRCRWRAARRLSPNRRYQCKGRSHVTLRHRRGAVLRGGRRVRAAGARQCAVDTRPLDPRLGFNDNAAVWGQISPEGDARLTEGLGAGLHRVTLDWRSAEPAPGVYQLGVYDRIYHDMLRHGIRPVFVLAYAPSWAWGPLAGCFRDCRYPPDPRYDGEWGQMAARIARRYPQAAGIEIWNEPNEQYFWQTRPDPRRYTELLVEASRAIKAANPSMRVISAGLTTRPVSGSSGVSLVDFLRGIYQNGGGGSFDALGLHLYPRGLDFYDVWHGLNTARTIENAYGDSHTPLWVTETGLTTSGDDSRRVSQADQARGIVDLYRRLEAQPRVGAVLFHTLIDPPGSIGDPESGFGLVRLNLTKKPAYCALAAQLRTGTPCP